MAYSGINNGHDRNTVKQEPTSHFHDLYNRLHAHLSAEDTRNVDNNDSAEDSGESPIDFSIKPKSKGYDEISGSDSISSPASSLNDTGGNLEDRKPDEDKLTNYLGSNESTDNSPISDIQQKRLDHLRHSSPLKLQIGEPRTADPTRSPANGSSPGPGLPGMLSGLQMGLPNANMLAHSFPAMAALMDPRRQLADAGSKNNRPFKAYPNDALSLAISTAGIPQYLTSFANFENSALTNGLNVSSEELFTIYKQQLLSLRERDKYFEALKQSQNAARSSSSSSSTTQSSIPPPYPSSHFSKTNGMNNNIIGSLPTPPISSDSMSSPLVGRNHNSNSVTNDDIHNSNLTSAGRRRPRSLPDDQKDELYWERRRKNNEAAKRSRDARRAKEDQIAIRAALLEQENLKLRVEVAALKTETAKLRCMLYNS